MMRLKCPARSRPYFPATNAFGGEGELREERQHVRHHEQLAGLGRSLQHGVGVLSRQRDGLLDENVFSCSQSGPRHFRMQMRRRADVDEIDIGIGAQFFKARIALDVAEIHPGTGRSKVTPNTAPVTGEFVGIARADSRDPPTPQLLRR